MLFKGTKRYLINLNFTGANLISTYPSRGCYVQEISDFWN